MTTAQRIELYTQAYTRWLRKKRDNMPEAFVGDEPDAKGFGIDEWVARKIREQVACEVGKWK